MSKRTASLFWRCLVMIPLCLCATRALAQEPGEDDLEVVKVRSNLVNIEVMVKEKGKYVTNLAADDFTVIENGVQQKVQFFEAPLAGGAGPATVGSSGAATAATTVGGRTATRAPNNIISLVLDAQTTESANLKQVREGLVQYIREQVAATDRVAVFVITNQLRLMQPFTSDKAQLIAAVERAYSGAGTSKTSEQRDIAETIAAQRETLLTSANAPPGSSAAAEALIAERVLQQYIKLRSALSVQQARPVLAALAALAEAQRDLPGKKTVVLFSQGFVAPSVLDWQIRSTIDIANRANVAIYVIDSAGLRGDAPNSIGIWASSPLDGISGLANQEQRIRAVGGETVFDYARLEGSNRNFDILYQISGETGGQFIKGTNDIGRGLNRIDQEIRARYTLAYQSTDPNFDGTFRKVKVEVRRPGAEVFARAGYYAVARDQLISLSADDKKLLGAIASARGDSALPVFMELTPFRIQEGRYVVPLALELPSAAVKFEQKGDKQQVHLDVLGVVRQGQGSILSRLGGDFNIGLTAEQYRAIQDYNIFYRQDLELVPGTYSIELLVRDKLSGKTTVRREQLILPAGDEAFSTSGVVLSRYVEPSPRQLAAGAGFDVLNQEGVQIRPSPAREFRATDKLIIFFELYNAAPGPETNKPRVKISVTLWKDGKAVTRPVNDELTETHNEPTPHLTFATYVSLKGLPPGSYTARIEATDTVTGKLVNRQEPFVIAK